MPRRLVAIVLKLVPVTHRLLSSNAALLSMPSS